MSTTLYEFRAAQACDLPSVSALLSECGLLADDLNPSTLEYFELAVDAQGLIVGLAGFDRAGSDALLRSLAVAANWRGRRLGEALVARRERLLSADDNGG
jgi:amino-acid N-acetyltransferase